MDREHTMRRGTFLRRAGVGVGALAAGGALPVLAQAATPLEVDALNLLLRVNRLEFAFYSDAVTKAKIKSDGELWQLAQVARLQERAHVRVLTRLLAGQAEPAPTYDFKEATTDAKQFGEAARTLEDLATQAVVGQAVRFSDRRLMAQLTALLAVDARHAAWARSLLGGLGNLSPSPDALENTRSAASVQRGIDQLGFVKST